MNYLFPILKFQHWDRFSVFVIVINLLLNHKKVKLLSEFSRSIQYFHNEKIIKFILSLAIVLWKFDWHRKMSWEIRRLEFLRVFLFSPHVHWIQNFNILHVFPVAVNFSFDFPFSFLSFFCYVNHKVNSSIINILLFLFSWQFSENWMLSSSLWNFDSWWENCQLTFSFSIFYVDYLFTFVFPISPSYNLWDQIHWYAALLKPVN